LRIYFRPLPGLTVLTAIFLAILLSLGTWQYHRLQWKTALLAEIETAANAPPFTSLREVQTALDAGEPVDFRRYGSNAMTLDPSENFYVFTSVNRDISWRIFAPIENHGVIIFCDLATVSDEMRNNIYGRGPSAEIAVIGYIRSARSKSRSDSKSTPDQNRWFGFNPLPKTNDWAEMAGVNADMRFYIDRVEGELDAFDIPIRRPDIRNNHLDYMLTWYSFAGIWLIIYFLLHRQQGRFGREQKI